MNFSESEIITGLLFREGYTPASNISDADLIILNTCTVRDTAANKIIGKLGELKRMKAGNPSLIIGVGGCFAQAECDYLRRRAPFVDFIFGTHNKFHLMELLTRVREKRALDDYETVYDTTLRDESVFDSGCTVHSNPGVAWIPIMQGCDNYCSYCIVPYVRGREISRPSREIINQISHLTKRGYKEVILLGQNVNSYGKRFSDLSEEPKSFPGLLRKIILIDGIERIRFITSHPKDFSDELLDLFTSEEKICNSLHLPVQSGSNRILKLMKRQYTREYYLDLVTRLRSKVPGLSLSTDIIVGFPGETEDDFLDTVDLVTRVRYEQGYMFRFSIRTGTEAEGLPGHLSEEEKKSRLRHLMEIQDKITEEESRNYSGKTLRVLVDGFDFKKNGEHLKGRSDSNKIVIFDGPESLIGEMVNVKIDSTTPYTLFGKVV